MFYKPGSKIDHERDEMLAIGLWIVVLLGVAGYWCLRVLGYVARAEAWW